MIVYIAGPYGAATPTEIDANVARACALGRYAALKGYTVIVPHAIGRLGCLGSPHEDGPDGVVTRQRSLRNGVKLARFVALSGGELWTLLRDDGSMSSGTKLEHDAWKGASDADVRAARWEDWVGAAARSDIDLDMIRREVEEELSSATFLNRRAGPAIDALNAAGFGRPGRPNSLDAMVAAALEDLQDHRAGEWLPVEIEGIGVLGEFYDVEASAPAGVTAWPGPWRLINDGVFEMEHETEGPPSKLLCKSSASQVLLRRRSSE